MSKRGRVTGVSVKYEKGKFKSSIHLPIMYINNNINYTALFWDEESVKDVLAPYYEKHQVKLTEELKLQFSSHGINIPDHDHLSSKSVMNLWKRLSDPPIMFAQFGGASFKAYF